MLRIGLVLLGLLVLVASFFVWVYPSMAPPPDPPEVIEARWALVGGWSRVDTFHGDPEELRRALEQFAASELVEHRRDAGPIAADAIDPPGRAALDALMTWGEDGGLGPELCIGNLHQGALPSFRLFLLAGVAIDSAEDPDAPELVAALRLGDALRDRGDLLQTLIGFTIARDALRAAEERGWAPGPAYLDHRPRREQVFPALAREAFCTDATLRERMREGGEPDFEVGVVGIGRELAMLRWYEGARIVGLEPHRGDLRALSRALADPPEPPVSPLVQVLAAGHGQVDELEDQIAAYDRFVKRAGARDE
ncbi:MAG: hypothetical protein R3B09_33545 [Nannocystaceae bacterium]